MKLKKSTKKSAISYILSFVLMLSLICISLISLGKYSMLSVHGVMHTCDRIDYYKGLNEELINEAYYIGIPYGIDKKCLKDVFSDKKIREDMSLVLTEKIKGKSYNVSTDVIGTKILKNAEKKYGTLNSDEKESLQKYMIDVEKLYQKKIVIPGTSYIVRSINISSTAAIVGIPIAVFIAILCIFILISMRYYLHHGLRYVIYGILGAGITLLTVFSAIISNGFIYKFNISDVYMRKFFTFYIGHEMLMQIFAGIALLLTGCVMIYVVIRQKRRKLKH